MNGNVRESERTNSSEIPPLKGVGGDVKGFAAKLNEIASSRSLPRTAGLLAMTV